MLRLIAIWLVLSGLQLHLSRAPWRVLRTFCHQLADPRGPEALPPKCLPHLHVGAEHHLQPKGKGVPGAMCCGKLYDSLRFGGILGPRVLCGQFVRFHFNFSAHPCRLQPMVLWPVRPSVIEKSTQWWQEWILSLRPCLVRPLHCLSLPVLNRADFVLMDRWGTLLHVTKNDIGSWCAFFVSCCQTAWPALSKQNRFW